MRQSCMLADKPGFGQIFDCGKCGNLHLSIGAVSLTLSPEAFLELVALMHTGAANFELWLEQNRPDYPDCRESIHADDVDSDPA